MRQRLIGLGTGAVLLLLVTCVPAGQPTAEKQRVAELIIQLGSDRFTDREEAREQLAGIGVPALAALRAAARTGDLETARRAALLIRTIEERSLTQHVLTPKKVHLKVTDVPVMQAVAKLARLSGYALRIDGDRTLLADRRVTLDTGHVTFWEAVDRLGASAGLAEKLTVASLPFHQQDVQAFIHTGFRPAPRIVNRQALSPAVVVPPLRLLRLPEPNAAPEPGGRNEPAQGLTVDAPALAPGHVVLTPGNAGKHVSYAGAARVLVSPLKRSGGASNVPAYELLLEACAEPGVLGFSVLGVPTVTRALDEHGQELTFVLDTASTTAATKSVEPAVVPNSGPAPTPRGMPLRLQTGSRPARKLKELSGSLTAQVIAPQTRLATFDDILNAKGRAADVLGGGQLRVEAIEAMDSGTKRAEPDGYRLILTFRNAPHSLQTVVVQNRVVQFFTDPFDDLVDTLVDDQGLSWTRQKVQWETVGDNQQLTLEYQRRPGVGAPVRLTLTGTAMPIITVPFRFVDVPLR